MAIGEQLRDDGVSAKPTSEERLAAIGDMASRGMLSGQIGDKLGHGAFHIRKLAGDAGIVIAADKALGRSHKRIDSNRIVEQTVVSLEGTETALRLVNYTELDLTQAPEWIAGLRRGETAVRHLRKRLEALRDDVQRTCPVCGAAVSGRPDAVYCGSPCRVRAHRQSKP